MIKEIITFDNNNYILIDEKTINNNKYVFLVNEEKNDDFVIRKLVNDSLVGLNDELEFNDVLIHFIKAKELELKNE